MENFSVTQKESKQKQIFLLDIDKGINDLFVEIK